MYERKPKVWNLKRPDVPTTAVYCGRGSPQGNPYRIGVDGTREEVCEKFKWNVLPTLDVSGLRGKDLVCYCKPKQCHCDDILIKANCTYVEKCNYPHCQPPCPRYRPSR